MKLAIFGATGGTGTQLATQALHAGHQVTAVVRDPARLTVHDTGLRTVTADLTDRAALVQALAGQDAVLSALGGKPPVATDGTREVLAAMAEAGVRRLVAVSAAPVAPDPPGENLMFRAVLSPLVRRLFRGVYADLATMEQAISATDTDWTVVRPPRLLDKPLTGRYRHSVGANPVGGHQISRADLAFAMLEFVQDDTRIGQAVGVAAA